jgi:hypothetical protein
MMKNKRFSDYCEELSLQAEAMERENQLHADAEHLAAYQFGRRVQRIEDSSNKLLGWLFCGLSGFFLGLAVAGFLTFWYLHTYFRF